MLLEWKLLVCMKLTLKNMQRKLLFITKKWKAQKEAKHPKLAYPKFQDLFDFEARIDEIRSANEADYQSVSERETKIDQAKIFAKRLRKFEQLKQEGKIIPWNERTKKEKQI